MKTNINNYIYESVNIYINLLCFSREKLFIKQQTVTYLILAGGWDVISDVRAGGGFVSVFVAN